MNLCIRDAEVNDTPYEIITRDGDRVWLLGDEYHREGAPAVIQSDGIEMWYQHGKLHREDGPAISVPNGRKSFYLNDVRLPVNAWIKELEKIDEEHATLMKLEHA